MQLNLDALRSNEREIELNKTWLLKAQTTNLAFENCQNYEFKKKFLYYTPLPLVWRGIPSKEMSQHHRHTNCTPIDSKLLAFNDVHFPLDQLFGKFLQGFSPASTILIHLGGFNQKTHL